MSGFGVIASVSKSKVFFLVSQFCTDIWLSHRKKSTTEAAEIIISLFLKSPEYNARNVF